MGGVTGVSLWTWIFTSPSIPIRYLPQQSLMGVIGIEIAKIPSKNCPGLPRNVEGLVLNQNGFSIRVYLWRYWTRQTWYKLYTHTNSISCVDVYCRQSCNQMTFMIKVMDYTFLRISVSWKYSQVFFVQKFFQSHFIDNNDIFSFVMLFIEMHGVSNEV